MPLRIDQPVDPLRAGKRVVGALQTWRDVRLESAFRDKAESD
jgi:hypothetical protein